jgi:TetR/AcrR family transcriptional regulator, transcriptional repressor for nem operon
VARIVKEQAYAVRRNEIVDAALRLVYTKGYEQMTIQDILDDLQISKGAFYHYFDSKTALLEALIERMMQEAVQVISPIVEDPHLPALEKFQRYFDTVARWKTAQKALMLALLQVWYTDDNAIVRQKMTSSGLKHITPMLTDIICQGAREGVFLTPHPEQVCEVAFSIMLSLGDSLAEVLLAHSPPDHMLQAMQKIVAVYTDALERILVAPSGSLQLIDEQSLKEWVTPDDPAGVTS